MAASHRYGAATKFKTEFETEVYLNIGLKPDFSVLPYVKKYGLWIPRST